MKAFVTGGTGFIGSWLIDSLIQTGWAVTALVREGSLYKIQKLDGLKILKGDLTDEIPGLEKALEGCDVVFHSAAILNRWGISRATYSKTNIDGTRRVLDASRGRAGRFVYVSSVGVMGENEGLDLDETRSSDHFKGKVGYHSTKAAAERFVLDFAGEMEVCVIRPTITYGPGDVDGMLTRLIHMIAKGRFIRIGKGLNLLHLTYIDDLIRGMLMAASHPQAGGQIFIIAGSELISLQELVYQIEIRLGHKPRRFYVPERLARTAALGVEGVYHIGSLLKITKGVEPFITRDKIDTLCNHQGFTYAKAERLLGYSPSTGISEGLEKTIRWMVDDGLLELPEGQEAVLRSHRKSAG
jgi:nucleoside-diphosphate-sugar epimerase